MAKELNFQASEGSLPPQNIDAEEAILGGILLDPEAISRVIEVLVPQAFYINAHQEIYRSALILHTQGKPTDLISVTTWLYDNQKLDKVGGQSFIAQLVDRTVSTVNIDALAGLVMDKYLRRKLIQAGVEIVQLGYETATDLETILDESQQKIFNLTQERPQEGLVHISQAVIQTFKNIEILNQGIALPGIPCGFYDLDAMTEGFQRSDLIILAARPSMGKTALGLNIAHNIATALKLPVAIFSLEMSKEQLVQRLLTTESKIESNRLRAGRVAQNEWESLSLAVSNLSSLPIFINDTPNITATQIRAHSRRLQAEQGGQLGLILLDYLQLMEGSGDNRVHELSKITRSLKGLARELNVPVIALSQLSRAVEARNNKRPMMSDLRESGCLTGDSLVTLADSGVQVPIRELVGKSGFAVWALNETTLKSLGVVPPPLKRRWRNDDTSEFIQSHAIIESNRSNATDPTCGLRESYALEDIDPLWVESRNHRLEMINHLKNGNPANTAEKLENPCLFRAGSVKMKLERAVVSNAFSTGIKPVFRLKTRLGCTIRATGNHKFLTIHGWKRLDELDSDWRIALTRCLPNSSVQYMSDAIALLSTSDVYWDEIVLIEADGEAEVYDLTVPGLHNFIANNIIVHNSIEQDADIVIMLYRDSYYNPDSPDRDIAEIIITKHRNGPTGTVKLLFNPQLTEFRNLAKKDF